MKASELLQPDEIQLLYLIQDTISEFEPILQNMVQAGLPLGKHWESLQERKRWNQAMFTALGLNPNRKPR